MPSLWFVCPAHGRVALARICLRQLRRTCDQLTADGVEATAVVIADDENLETARALGFNTYVRDNRATSRKYNDGFQLALDPAFNGRPADYVVPIGSDDWIDHRVLLDLPDNRTVVGFQRMSFVREDGREITVRQLTNPAGAGIRIYPRQLLQRHSPPTPGDTWRPYRPGAEDKRRACDTSILTNLQRHWQGALRIEHRHLHDRQIVDWKTAGTQLNPYETLRRWKPSGAGDPFVELDGLYPADALAEMRAHYGLVREAVAA